MVDINFIDTYIYFFIFRRVFLLETRLRNVTLFCSPRRRRICDNAFFRVEHFANVLFVT
jgi:hypothetical protein